MIHSTAVKRNERNDCDTGNLVASGMKLMYAYKLHQQSLQLETFCFLPFERTTFYYRVHRCET